MTPSEIEPATFRCVAQHLNHRAIAVPEFVCRYRNIVGPCCLLLHGRYVGCYRGAEISLAASLSQVSSLSLNCRVDGGGRRFPNVGTYSSVCLVSCTSREELQSVPRSENLMWLKLTRDNASVLSRENISTLAFVLRCTIPKVWSLTTTIWTLT